MLELGVRRSSFTRSISYSMLVPENVSCMRLLYYGVWPRHLWAPWSVGQCDSTFGTCLQPMQISTELLDSLFKPFGVSSLLFPPVPFLDTFSLKASQSLFRFDISWKRHTIIKRVQSFGKNNNFFPVATLARRQFLSNLFQFSVLNKVKKRTGKRRK